MTRPECFEVDPDVDSGCFICVGCGRIVDDDHTLLEWCPFCECDNTFIGMTIAIRIGLAHPGPWEKTNWVPSPGQVTRLP